MIKAIIVDDEQMTRKGLLNYINWDSIGIEIAGEATDGVEGFELAIEKRPDIAICDVRMPKMDGIRLAHHIKEILPNCKIIFLSGYSDKEYLKSAIQLKAVDYIEKPVNLKEFQELLRKTVEACYEEKNKLTYFKNSILMQLIKNKEVDLERVKEGFVLADVRLPVASKYFCVVFKLQDKNKVEEITNLISNVFLSRGRTFLVANEGDEVILIDAVEDELEIGTIKELCFDTVKKLQEGFQVLSLCAIGNAAKNINDISQSYKEAKDLLKTKSLKGESIVITFETNREKAIIRSIEKHIEENYQKDITVNSIASAVYLTPQYLCLLYKKETNKTINDYITEVRMEAAKELLKDPRLKLYEVAHQVGYNDANYFAKLFKKVVGYKPSEYRDRT